MPGSSEGLHEAPETLSTTARDMHRALVSLQEELEAVDWYQQRAEACLDEDLRAVLEHNRREEIEHAAMLLEWLRRRDPSFAGHLRDDLFSQAPITDVEEPATQDPQPQPEEPPADSEGFTIGSLKEHP
ncbi:encapsulin-associated ferritin-like protein [Thiocystis violacea]|uniref:encapsulin-associated ferritin-like protein n=1 Tax=Thiocystis violacea TaxID=13725 RepID=UPI001903902A|nr:ferritin-like domain-containing protein [Thiocystis violacea]MBK1724242.1 ferritin [Thiocystis violacea]